MKNVLLLLIFTFCILNVALPQGGVWTWISGDNGIGSLGNYGTQGIPSTANHPPADYEPCEWKDKQGNFWVYSGWSRYSDLWKYNPITNEWTWVKGYGLLFQSPVYGIKGVPDTANTPGTRAGAEPTWVDTSGNLWLFGAAGSGLRNDLWKYDIGINQWTWMSGDSSLQASGVHGTQGIPSVSNVPGARWETCSSWMDSLNQLWLFGGDGVGDNGGIGNLNDLMKYNINTNEWTWMSGSALINAIGNYGMKGIPNINNVPGARMSYTKWKDKIGNFWIMGGLNNVTNAICYNDVWKYDSGTNEWTWMDGPNFPDDVGIYTGYCDNSSFPCSRFEQRASVTDNCGNFWMFGAFTISAYGHLNELFIFNSNQIKWKMISGSHILNQTNNYGTLGIASPLNMPSSRYGAVAWWGNDNKYYMFGGYQPAPSGSICDLWVFNPDSNCIGTCSCNLSAPTLTQSNDTLSIPPTYATYQWYHDSISISGATQNYYVAPASGNYAIFVTDSNGCSVSTEIINVIANVESLINTKESFLFPNPFSNSFQVIVIDNEQAQITIYDMLSRNLLQKTFLNSTTVNTNELEKGIYIYEVRNRNKVIRLGKVVKE